MAEPNFISSVKRHAQNKLERLRKRDELRAQLPILTKHEITRFRLEFYQALFIELNDNGYLGTARLVNDLINLQDFLRHHHGPDSLVWMRPQLKNKPKLLEKLCDGLVQAENYHQEGDTPKEVTQLVKVGLPFGFAYPNADWHWLAEQIFIQAIRSSYGCTSDGSRVDALANYVYGKFIFEKMDDISMAKEYLERCRALSIGTQWHAKKELEQKDQGTLFAESCKLLHKILLTQAKTALKYDPMYAARLCALSRKRALDACYKQGQAEAFSQQGVCLMLANEPNMALIAFIKAYRFQNELHNIIGICDELINVAMAYSKLGMKEEAEAQFEKLLQLAEENDLSYYKGQANRFLGEYHLTQGNPTAATPVLLKALEIFHSLNKHANMEQTRNLASIAQGQELIERYISLILKCSRKDVGENNMAKLLKWKDFREPFWLEMPSPFPSQTVFSYDFSTRQSLIYPPHIYTFKKYCDTHADTKKIDDLMLRPLTEESDESKESSKESVEMTYEEEEEEEEADIGKYIADEDMEMLEMLEDEYEYVEENFPDPMSTTDAGDSTDVVTQSEVNERTISTPPPSEVSKSE